MLDLSIPKLEKCTTKKRYEDFLKCWRWTITEKFDGTKLTFLKTGPGADDWLLAYKGSVLPKALFKHLILQGGRWRYTHTMIKRQSVGFLQYIMAFDHLMALDVKLEQIPANTEVFIEFIQRKSTVLSEYERIHDMFVLDAGPCEWFIDSSGSRITTFPRPGNKALLDTVTRAMVLRQPRILFDGTLGEDSALYGGHGSLLNLPRMSDFAGWKEHQEALFEALVSFESTLGGQPEGVVLSDGDGEVIRKVVRSDQCDKATRAAKKAKFRYEDPKAETSYWSAVVANARSLVTSTLTFKPKTLDEALEMLGKIFMRFTPDVNITAPRSEINFIEDVMLTAKLRLERVMWTQDVGSIGVFVMAGKPVHLGHWKMIKRAAYENEKLLLVVSTADRDEVSGEDMFRVWMELLALELPKNVVLRFSASPYLDAVHELKALAEETSARLAVYGDPHDISKSWSPDVIRKKLPDLADNRLWVFPIARESVVNISGTEMRDHLQMGKKEEFLKNLPPISDANKARYWDILRKGYGR